MVFLYSSSIRFPRYSSYNLCTSYKVTSSPSIPKASDTLLSLPKPNLFMSETYLRIFYRKIFHIRSSPNKDNNFYLSLSFPLLLMSISSANHRPYHRLDYSRWESTYKLLQIIHICESTPKPTLISQVFPIGPVSKSFGPGS